MAPVDCGKLRAHVDFVRGTVRRLERLNAEGRRAFLEDEVVQAAATRWLQIAIEALAPSSVGRSRSSVRPGHPGRWRSGTPPPL
jgi:hypothetical protein